MNEELEKSPLPGIEPVGEDGAQSPEKASSETDDSESAKEDFMSDPMEVKEEDNNGGAEPPIDWLEPLEEDEDDFSIGRNDPEEESLAGESESVAGSEKGFKKMFSLSIPRRRRSRRDEGWEAWPVLGEGWRRKEVVRRSGSSIGQKDVYYIGPRGERVRSRVELLSVLEGELDLSHFDYKSGTFFDSNRPPVKIRHRMRKKVRERSSSESSFMERGEGADTPDSYHRLTPNLTSKHVNSSQTTLSWNNAAGTQSQSTPHVKTEEKIKLPFPSPSRPMTLPSINGTSRAGDSPLICAKCGVSFIGTWYDKQRKKPCCSTCWASKTKEHPMIRFRKWIPCGQCVGCHNTINCGQCANCKHGLQSPETRRRVCRKRRCICPIRKGSGQVSYAQQKSYSEAPEALDDDVSLQSEVAESQQSLKNSDTENVSLNIDNDDDDDMSTDDDDDWHKKRKRRSCGECKACRCRRDCGTCDFCVDKPKFGGSNKKRQKCRLRQCQRQAMRHLLPFQMGQGDNGPDGPLPGRPKPHYTYSRKSGFKRKKDPQLDVDESDDDEDSRLQPLNWSSELQNRSKPSSESTPLNHSDDVQNGLSDRVPPISNHNSQPDQQSRRHPGRSHTFSNHQQPVEEDDDDEDEEEEDDDEYDDDEDELPMIANVFSFADNPAMSGDVENQLLKLLHSLRSSVLPITWYAILVEGPQLQLIQCSKQSNMTDTMVLIDPGFCYQVTVQRQPLLPTHPLYDNYPARLTSVTEVVNLLLGLEKYAVCQGLPPRDAWLRMDPIILERASTCDFLVSKNVSICSNCQDLQEH